jgi:uncharacterized LabA/DUF88 family protein
MTIPRTFVFVDGENLVMRYQAMVAAGAKPRKDVRHISDTFLWHPKITTWSCMDIARVTYYTSATGDDKRLTEMRSQIASTTFDYNYDPSDDVQPGTSQLVPRIFHKPSKSRKTRNVDINIVIDVMRTANLDNAGLLYILSGDGDYLPLVEEVGRRGKEIYMSAFSSGLNEQLRSSVDLFQSLDEIFFTPAPKA